MQTNKSFSKVTAEPVESDGSGRPLGSVSDAAKGDTQRLNTKVEIAARLRKTPRTIDTWMADGRLPYYKIGRSVLFDWDDVQRHLNEYFHVSRFSTKAKRKSGAHA
jgi:excisionase family DNA binding protein